MQQQLLNTITVYRGDIDIGVCLSLNTKINYQYWVSHGKEIIKQHINMVTYRIGNERKASLTIIHCQDSNHNPNRTIRLYRL